MADYTLKLFDRDLIRFSARDTGDTPEVSITDVDQETLPLMPLGVEVTDSGLARWLKHRKIPRNRAYIHSFLAKVGLSANSTLGIINISSPALYEAATSGGAASPADLQTEAAPPV